MYSNGSVKDNVKIAEEMSGFFPTGLEGDELYVQTTH